MKSQMKVKYRGFTIAYTQSEYPGAHNVELFTKLVNVLLGQDEKLDPSLMPWKAGQPIQVVSFPEPEKKINAIKFLREVTGLGLAEAKAVVESAHSFMPGCDGFSMLQSQGWRFARSKLSDVSLRTTMENIVDARQRFIPDGCKLVHAPGSLYLVHAYPTTKIEAIKKLRDYTAYTLNTAKAVVDGELAVNFDSRVFNDLQDAGWRFELNMGQKPEL